ALLTSALVACSSKTTSTTPGLKVDRAPNLVLYNADVQTMDAAKPRATAIAIAGDAIIAVGDDQTVRALATGATRQIDAGGHTITPGLIDAHCHLYGLGVDRENVSVRGLESEAATVQKLADAAKQRPAGEWLIGRGWDQN